MVNGGELGGWTATGTTIVKRLPRRRVYIGQTDVHSGNRGIWHSEPSLARLDVSDGLVKAAGARGGEALTSGFDRVPSTLGRNPAI